jgi:hypothetical protein
LCIRTVYPVHHEFSTSFCFYFFFSHFGTKNRVSFISAVRAGAGGDEAGIWAGDLVGR